MLFVALPGLTWTKRYAWGIQQLVSTHQLPHESLGKGGILQLKSKMPISDQIFIFGGGWRAVTTPDQLKSKVPSPDKIFIEIFPEILE